MLSRSLSFCSDAVTVMSLVYLLARASNALAIHSRYEHAEPLWSVVLQFILFAAASVLAWKYLGVSQKPSGRQKHLLAKVVGMILVTCCSLSMLRLAYHFWECSVDRAKTPCAVLAEWTGQDYLAERIFSSRNWFPDTFESCATWRSSCKSWSEMEIVRRKEAVASYYGSESAHMARFNERVGGMLQYTKNYPPEAKHYLQEAYTGFERNLAKEACFDLRSLLAAQSNSDPLETRRQALLASSLLPLKSPTRWSECSLDILAHFAKKHNLPNQSLYEKEIARLKTEEQTKARPDFSFAYTIFGFSVLGLSLKTGFVFDLLKRAYFSITANKCQYQLRTNLHKDLRVKIRQQQIAAEIRRGNFPHALKLSAAELEELGETVAFKPTELPWRFLTPQLMLSQLHAGLFIATFFVIWM